MQMPVVAGDFGWSGDRCQTRAKHWDLPKCCCAWTASTPTRYVPLCSFLELVVEDVLEFDIQFVRGFHHEEVADSTDKPEVDTVPLE